MRIERIEADTRYLPVLFIKKDKPSEVSETMEQNAIATDIFSTERNTTNVQEEDVISAMENNDTSNKISKFETENNLDCKEEVSTTRDEENNNSDKSLDDIVNNEGHDAEVIEPITIDDESAVNFEVEFDENSEDTIEEVTVKETDNDSAFRNEYTWNSSLYKEDEYEEEYGDMIAPRIQKMKKRSTTPTEKFLNRKMKTATVKNSDIINHQFELNGFLVVESSKPQTIEGLKNLTYQIGENYSNIAPLLKEIRKGICIPNAKGNRNICFKFDRTAGRFYHQFCCKMKQYGLFTKSFINGNILTASISSVPRVISYLNGQWLEMYASFILEDVVSEYAKTNGYEYEILTNVKVTNITSVHVYAHEIDCVISIGDKCFAFEMKSGGQFDDYSGLYKTRKELCFVPDRYLLLSTELDEETAEVLQYFYEFYITGMGGFKNRLIEMINKAFAN